MSGSPPRIVVVGSTNTDLVVPVSRLPAAGETILGGAMETVAGGKGANQAVAAARLGAHVTFVARVGDDAFGEEALAGFRAENIEISHVLVTPGIASGVALIAVREDTGENLIIVAPGANGFLSAEDVDAASDAFDSAQAIIVSLEVPMEAVTRAVEMGRARRVPVLLNPAPARPLPAELLAQVALLTPNETEARLLTGAGPDADSYAVAARLLETGVDAAVMTLGPAGALVVTPDGVEHIPAIAVRAVDTVAAGDCFTGVLAVEIASGHSLRDAARYAVAAAAVSVTRRGAQPSMPARDEVAAFLRATTA